MRKIHTLFFTIIIAVNCLAISVAADDISDAIIIEEDSKVGEEGQYSESADDIVDEIIEIEEESEYQVEAETADIQEIQTETEMLSSEANDTEVIMNIESVPDDISEEISVSSDASGTCGDDLTWSYSSGILTISGTGDMVDWTSHSSKPWSGYNITSVVIGNGVTSIGKYAFSYCKITSVMIPDSVTSIGEHAFSYCTSLTSVTIPDNVTSMGDYAFYGCTSLTSVMIGDSVTSIGVRAFQNCTNLTSVTIGDSVISIDGFAFSLCTSLTSATIPDSVTSIGEYAFSQCTSLTSVTIPDSVTSIGDYAFYGCTSLTSATIPNNITSIGSCVFSCCMSLTSITIGDGVTSIGGSAFSYCTGLTSVTIGDSVTSIGTFAFYGCTSLTDVYYAGSADEWDAISIGSQNTYLTSATIHYNSTGPEEASSLNAISIAKYDEDEGIYTEEYDELLVGDSVKFSVEVTVDSDMELSFSEGNWSCSTTEEDESPLTFGSLSVEGSDTDETADSQIIYAVSIYATLNEGGSYTVTFNSPSGDTGEVTIDITDLRTQISFDASLYTNPDYCLVGETVELYGMIGSQSEEFDVETAMEMVTWEISDTSAAEIESWTIVGKDLLNSDFYVFALTVNTMKAAEVTFTGTTEDGLSASYILSIEPEMLISVPDSVYKPDQITCSVSLDEADYAYLESFMSGLSYTISYPSAGYQETLEVTKEAYEISSDGCSAVYTLYVTASGGSDTLYNEDGRRAVITFVSAGGQECEADTDVLVIPALQLQYTVTGSSMWYNNGLVLAWEDGTYNCSGIDVQVTLRYMPGIEDYDNSDLKATVNSLSVSLDGLDMFKVDGDSEISIDVELSPGESYTYTVHLVKKGMFWKEPDTITGEGSIIVEVDGEFPEMASNSLSKQLDITVENKDLEEEQTEEEEVSDEEIAEAAGDVVALYESLADKLAMDDLTLEEYLGEDQAAALKLVIYTQIALANLSEDVWSNAGFSEEIAEKVMDKFLGDWKSVLGADSYSVPITVIIESEEYGSVQCTFTCNLTRYTVDDKAYGMTGTIQGELTILSSGKTISLATGILAETDMTAFVEGMQSTVLKSLKKGFNSVWGNDANTAVSYAVTDSIDSIASRAATYGLEEPVKEVLEAFYNEKLKKSFSSKTFEILTYPSKTVSVHCPVDVYIYDSAGNLVGSIEGDEVTLSGDNMVLWTVGDSKYAQLFDETFTIVYKSTGTGTMTLIVYEQTSGLSDIRSYTFEEVPLTEGLEYTNQINSNLLTDTSNYDLVSNDGDVISADSVTWLDNGHSHYWVYTDNEDGTHTGSCTCGKTVTSEHIYSNNVCTLCGSISYIDISSFSVSLDVYSFTYDGTAITPSVTVSDASNELTYGTDYTISYDNNTNAGIATITVTGVGIYTGYVSKNFTIEKTDQEVTAAISPSIIEIGETASITASGIGEITYSVDNTNISTVGKDGTVAGISAGMAIITVTAAGNENYNAGTATIEITVNEAAYTGNNNDDSDSAANTSSEKDNVETATESIGSFGNTDASSETEVVTNATGVISSLKNTTKGIQIKWKSVSGADGYYIYRKTGSSKNFTLIKIVTDASTVSYTDIAVKSKNGITYIYKVVPFSGSTEGSGEPVTILRLVSVKLSSVKKSSSKKIIVKWKKTTKVSGYQIQYSTSKTFKKGNKTIKVSGAKKTSRILSKLKSGKTYYVRIRTYKKVNGVTYYSAWSNKKKVKLKK